MQSITEDRTAPVSADLNTESLAWADKGEDAFDLPDVDDTELCTRIIDVPVLEEHTRVDEVEALQAALNQYYDTYERSLRIPLL